MAPSGSDLRHVKPGENFKPDDIVKDEDKDWDFEGITTAMEDECSRFQGEFPRKKILVDSDLQSQLLKR